MNVSEFLYESGKDNFSKEKLSSRTFKNPSQGYGSNEPLTAWSLALCGPCIAQGVNDTSITVSAHPESGLCTSSLPRLTEYNGGGVEEEEKKEKQEEQEEVEEEEAEEREE